MKNTTTSELHLHLLKMIDDRDEIIKEQKEFIQKLLNENAEQENTINVMMKQRL